MDVVTFVPSIYSDHIFAPTTLDAVVDSIRSGEYSMVGPKQSLPAWAFNGMFSGSVCNDGFIQSTGLFHIDIDHVQDIQMMRWQLMAEPSLVLMFLSPSGTGLKACLRINHDRVSCDEDFKQVFGYVQTMMAAQGITIDRSCCDVRRLCFVSSDPDVYYNPDAPAIMLPVFPPRADVIHSDAAVNMTDLMSALAAVSSDDRATWISVGQALKTLPDDQGWEIYDNWSKRSTKYDARDCERVWRGFKGLRTNVRSIFNIAAAHGWVNPGRPIDLTGVFNGATDNDDLLAIIRGIKNALTRYLGEDGAAIAIYPEVIDRMINGTIWSGSRGRIMMLSRDQNLNQYEGSKAYRYMAKTFGEALDAHAVDTWVTAFMTGQAATDTQTTTMLKRVAEAWQQVILDHIMMHNQRETVEWRTDMFASQSMMQIVPDKARVVMRHEPWVYRGPYNEAVIADFKQHFTRFEQFLEFVVMSRFAADRKKSYLWILADSDWGKNFLMSALKELGICVETSVREIEGMLEGKPSGMSPVDFKRAMVLFIDEFKTVKSEIKQLQSEIKLSPKNQLSCTVEIFAKVFMSAESVASLVGDNGVEDQFANRMSIFKEHGSIVSRPLFIELGGAAYMESLVRYIIEFMNKRIREMINMGKLPAQTHAQKWIDGFIGAYGLGTMFDVLSKTLPAMVEEMRSTFINDMRYVNDTVRVEDRIYLLKPTKVIERYIIESYDYSQQSTLNRKKSTLIELLGGVGSFRTPTGVMKGVRIR